jgi:hypothetical protein
VLTTPTPDTKDAKRGATAPKPATPKVRACARVRVWARVRVHACVRACVCARPCVHMCARVCSCMRACVCASVRACVCMRARVCLRACVRPVGAAVTTRSRKPSVRRSPSPPWLPSAYRQPPLPARRRAAPARARAAACCSVLRRRPPLPHAPRSQHDLRPGRWRVSATRSRSPLAGNAATPAWGAAAHGDGVGCSGTPPRRRPLRRRRAPRRECPPRALCAVEGWGVPAVGTWCLRRPRTKPATKPAPARSGMPNHSPAQVQARAAAARASQRGHDAKAAVGRSSGTSRPS